MQHGDRVPLGLLQLDNVPAEKDRQRVASNPLSSRGAPATAPANWNPILVRALLLVRTQLEWTHDPIPAQGLSPGDSPGLFFPLSLLAGVAMWLMAAAVNGFRAPAGQGAG
jgi:hypothetical protein